MPASSATIGCSIAAFRVKVIGLAPCPLVRSQRYLVYSTVSASPYPSIDQLRYEALLLLPSQIGAFLSVRPTTQPSTRSRQDGRAAATIKSSRMQNRDGGLWAAEPAPRVRPSRSRKSRQDKAQLAEQAGQAGDTAGRAHPIGIEHKFWISFPVPFGALVFPAVTARCAFIL